MQFSPHAGRDSTGSSKVHREVVPARGHALRQLRSITITISTSTSITTSVATAITIAITAASAPGLVALALPLPAHAGSLSGTAAYRERIALPSTPVLRGGPSQPLSLRLIAVGTGRPPLPSFPLGRLPASWRGDLAFAGGMTRWQLDLAADGSFQLRQSFLDRPAPNRFDDIGRWRIEPGSNRLVLRGGREAPLFFQPLEGGAALAKLDLQGEPLRSRQPDRLQRLATPQPIDPRLHLVGMFRYLADAANIRLCATGARLPVAMEADYRSLEQAYLKAQPVDQRGQPLLVNLEGLITNRPSAEPGQPPQRSLVVERFVGVHPGQGCPQPNPSANASPAPASRPMAPLSLRGSLWQLQTLQHANSTTLFKPPGPAPELLLAVDQERVSGTGGCNRLMGGFRLAGEELSFSRLASTQMACPPEVMAFERRYSEALAQVRRWSIDKRNLLLQNAAGRTLLLFRDAQ